jgi:hypothetical protein
MHPTILKERCPRAKGEKKVDVQERESFEPNR